MGLTNRKLFCSIWFITMSLFSTGYASNIITWVPPYNWQACLNMLNTDFGGVKMEDGITHLALQFWGPVPSTGGIKYVDHEWQTPNDATVTEFTDWAQGKDVKVMLCIYNNDSTWNWDIVQPIIDDPAKRTNHVNTLVSEVQRLGLDGVEVDYEWPGGENSDHTNFMLFMAELSNELRAIGKQLTIATFAYTWHYPNSDGWNAFADITDGITSMGYEEIGRNANGWASYSGQKNLINIPEKLMLGMPTYAGSSWQGNTIEEQIDWVVEDGEVGIGIWDASLADGAGNPNDAWRTASVWNKLKQIKDRDPSTSMQAAYFTPVQRSEYGIRLRMNPVNVKCNDLKFQIKSPVQTKARASIYDASGKQIWIRNFTTDINGNSKTLIWNTINQNGRKIPSGTYLLRVEADGVNSQDSYSYSEKFGVAR